MGNGLIGRNRELEQLSLCISEGRHAMMSEPPGSGIRTLVQHFLDSSGLPHSVLDMLAVRSIHPIERAVHKIAARTEGKTLLWIKNFHNLLLFEDPAAAQKSIERLLAGCGNLICIFSSSHINAMDRIFRRQRFLQGQCRRIRLWPIDEKLMVEHTINEFSKMGRVVSYDQIKLLHRSVDGNPWYFIHLCDICFSKTIGYVTDKNIEDSIQSLLSIHHTRFEAIMHELSTHQVNFLKAVFDSVKRFSSAESISYYGLNSSANIHRVREALLKKEVISIDESDIPYIIDPLFHLWLKSYYA